MKVTKFIFLLTFVLAMIIATSDSNAAFFTWTGVGDGTSWDDPMNWDQLQVPPHDSGDLQLRDQTYGPVITIDADVAADCTFGHPDGFGTIFGPEFGMDLDIYGSLTYQWSMATFQNNPADRSIINVYDGATINSPDGRSEDIAIGNVWWDHSGPYVTMNMYGDSACYVNWFWFGGHLNLYGGTMDILTGVAMDGSTDPNTLLDIYEGTLILPADYTDFVNDLILRDVLKAYGGVGTILIDTEINPGRTTVTAIPEPSTLALLCLGGLTLVRRKREK